MPSLGKKLEDQILEAISRRDWNTVKAVVGMGIDGESSKIQKAFRLAASKGQDDLVELFLEKGIQVDYNDNKAVRWAAKEGHTAVVKALIAHGADIHAQDSEALINAAKGGHTETVALLLAHEADVHARDDAALELAARFGRTHTVTLLLGAGADLHARADKALRLAARYGHLETVQTLLSHGANVFAENGEALKLARQHGKTDTAEFLQNWIEKEERQTAQNDFHSLFGDTYTLEQLRTDIDDEGTTGLHLAAQAGVFDEIVAYITKTAHEQLSCEDVTRPDARGNSILSQLTQQNALNVLMTPALWSGQSSELQKLAQHLTEDQKKDLNFDEVWSRVNILSVRQKAAMNRPKR